MLSCLLFLLCHSISGTPGLSNLAPNMSGPVISIIMDDLGYNLNAGRKTVALSRSITVSILPGRPFTESIAQLAVESGNEVMVHLPMQSIHSEKSLGFGGLTENLSQKEFDRRVDLALRSVPFARGVNNHMGSLLTRKSQQMNWLMQALAERYRSFYFVDSKTTARSVAEKVANYHYIPAMGRDIFLDDLKDSAQIDKQFDHLIKLAKHRGFAVAIAHPYEETLSVLARRLPAIQNDGVKLVAVSELIYLTQTPSLWFVSSSH